MSRFHINLKVGQDIAFHLNPRFNEMVIVRNSQFRGQWGPEERHLPGSMPLHPQQAFTVSVWGGPFSGALSFPWEIANSHLCFIMVAFPGYNVCMVFHVFVLDIVFCGVCLNWMLGSHSTFPEVKDSRELAEKALGRGEWVAFSRGGEPPSQQQKFPTGSRVDSVYTHPNFCFSVFPLCTHQ